jgi:hypothetical protein
VTLGLLSFSLRSPMSLWLYVAHLDVPRGVVRIDDLDIESAVS